MEERLSILLKSIPTVQTGYRMVLGIDGLSRSGKTTCAEKLCNVFHEKNVPTCVLHMDDFIVERKKRYHTAHEEWYEYYGLQWEVEWLRENMFMALKETDNLSLPFYDSERDEHRIQNIPIPESCLIVVEGVFLQRREWRAFFDFVVYLDCDRRERFSREHHSTRLQIDKFRNRYWKAEDHYLTTVVPTQKADLVLKS